MTLRISFYEGLSQAAGEAVSTAPRRGWFPANVSMSVSISVASVSIAIPNAESHQVLFEIGVSINVSTVVFIDELFPIIRGCNH